MNLRNTLTLALSLSIAGMACSGAEECSASYFAHTDTLRRFPLERPPRDFAAELKAAREGVSAAQRSLAISYEAGYRVAPCLEKALHWYAKAARADDKFAQQALARHQQFIDQLNGPECLGRHCSGTGKNNTISLQARDNHFYAPVTINGLTREGVIDTGATLVSMSAETARYFGIDHSQGTAGMAETANGISNIRIVTVASIDVAGITLENIPVAVGDSKHPILIGMAFLKHLRTSIEGGTLTLSR